MPSLRARTIRLASENNTLRPHLLRALQAADEEGSETEADKAARFTEGPKGKKEFEAWIKTQPKSVQDDWEANKDKYQDKFKSAAARLFREAVDKRAGCDKLPNEAMQAECEKKKEGGEDKEAALRAATIRLAKENPALRPHLLPLLSTKTAKVTMYDGVVGMWLEKDKANAKKDPEASAKKLMEHLKRLKAWDSSNTLDELTAVLKAHL